MIDAYKAVLAARSYRSPAKAKAGHAVVVSATQFNAVGRRSTKERFTETLTNAGQGPVTVHLSGRALSPYTTIASRKLHLTRANKFHRQGEVPRRGRPGQIERVGRDPAALRTST